MVHTMNKTICTLPGKRSLIAAAIVATFSTNLTAQENQNETSADDSDVERIFVTASKRLRGLQETPVAVTVTSGETIEQTKVLDISDLQTLVPTLRVTPLQRSTNTNFSIRGFGNGTNNLGIEPSVGIFIDGVYRSRAAAQIGDLPRLQQIEVLSGPQSTLFGKNASAGVISVRTLEPGFESEGKIEVGLGNYSQRLIKGFYTNGISDNVAFSVSGGTHQRDGYSKSHPDVNNGIEDLNDRDRWNIRGQLLWEATDDTKVRLIVDASEIDEICCTTANVINGPTAVAVQFLGGVVLDSSEPFAFQSALNRSPQNTVEDSGISLQVDVDYDTFSFTSITALRSNDQESGGGRGVNEGNDIDYTSLDILRNYTHAEIETFTQEFRLTSTGDNTFDWMLGAFYFTEEMENGDLLTFGSGMRPYFDVLLGAFPGILGTVEGILADVEPGQFFATGSQIQTEHTQDNDAYSLFATFDYKLTQQLIATFGLSYTNDEKDITLAQPINTDVISSFEFATAPTIVGVPFGLIPDFQPLLPTLQSFQFVPPNLDLPNSVESNSSSDSKTTWSARLAYEVNDNINVFATASTGFKASSWNLSRDTRPFPSDATALVAAGLTQPNQTYGTRFAAPEEAKVYELGLKARFKKGAFNMTLFDQTINGFQSSIFSGTGFVLANAGKQSTKGLEFDSLFKVTDTVTLTLAGTLLDPVYDSFVGASGVNGPVDLSGETPAGIHERSYTAGVAYNFELAGGTTGYARVDYLYESETRLVENIPPELTRDVSTFNASAGLSFENGVKVALWVRNLNNDEYYYSAFPPPIQAGSFNAYPSQPRTYGATISYQW